MNRLGSFAVLVTIFLGESALAAQSPSSEMDRLASDKGCYLCHSRSPARPVKDAQLPYAPSWQGIARMYKGQKDAEARLTEIILGGSGLDPKDRHWQGKVRDVGMLPNVQQVDEDQARRLVRWILRSR